ncbi:hypothetical protein ACFX4N_23810 [Priestia sp. YIM B13551]|uniref:hypothetical protein n=1 Tax=Priestia sp. YIM B13551 TaxID=3366306 RepID=UPI003670B4AE
MAVSQRFINLFEKQLMKNPDLAEKVTGTFNRKQTVNVPIKQTSNGHNTASHLNQALNKSGTSNKVLDSMVDDAVKMRRETSKPIGTLNRSERKIAERQKSEKEFDKGVSSLDGIKANEKLLPSIGATASTLFKSARTNLGAKGSMKSAAIGTFQASAASAAVSGGIAALQGNDPWEAAKTGFVRGAMAGGTYQGLKAATHANAGSIKGNLKHIASTTKQTYQAHTMAGNAGMRQGGVSRQLEKVLKASQMNRQNIAHNGLYKNQKG